MGKLCIGAICNLFIFHLAHWTLKMHYYMNSKQVIEYLYFIIVSVF